MTKTPLMLTTEELKSRPNLVAVDGILYNIAGFAPHHPGGTHIQGAGAYDASALYASMHPGRPALSSDLLQQYRVGEHVRSVASCKEDVIYRFDSPFAVDLLKIVRSSVKKSWWAPVGFYARIFIIAVATLWCEYQFITKGAIFWAVLVGVCHAQIGLSVQHDASHGAISKNFYINEFFSYGADWIGSSKWIWFQQHILWHHPHTNHPELDPDTTSAEPLVKFQPRGEGSWWHPYQHMFIHFVLSFYGPTVVFNPMHITTMRHNDNVAASVGKTDYMKKQKIFAIVLRLFYFARIIAAPWYFGGANLLVGALVPNLVNGILLTFVFVVSHNFLGSDRNPTASSSASISSSSAVAVEATKKEEKDGNDARPCWYKAQAETSCTYGGTIGMLLTGGLNLQIEHHLFPRLSSWYYPTIQEDVRACCERHGVRYAYFPTLFHNVRDMLLYMQKVGIAAVIKEHAH